MTTEERFRLELGECIGRGGFGTVYRGTLHGRRGFAKQVAVKVVARDAGTGVAERLRDEGRMLALIRHRAIVQVDDLVQIGEDWALVMEWIDGVDLAALGELGPVPVSAASEIMAELAGALHVAFTTAGPDGRTLRLVHRDVKPPNVLLTADGATKLLDFGIARASFGTREALTLDTSYGSFSYMSPERLDGVEDAKGDVYSLGVVAYELLTGQLFGKTSPRRDRHEKRRADALLLLQAAGVPAAVRDLLQRMVAYLPDDRPELKEVEGACIGFRALGGPSLREWAEHNVPIARARRAAVPDTLGLAEREVTARSTPRPAVPRSVADIRVAEPEVEELPRFVPAPEPSPSRWRPRWVVGAAAAVLAAVAIGGVAVAALSVDGSAAAFGGAVAPPEVQPALQPSEVVEAPPPISPAVAEVPAPVSPPEPPPAPAPKPEVRAKATPPSRAPVERPARVASSPAVVPPVAKTVVVPPPPSAPAVVEATFAPQRAMVQLDGRASAWLVGGGARWRIPGAVPPGTYDIVAEDDGIERKTGEAILGAGEIVRIACDRTGCRRPAP